MIPAGICRKAPEARSARASGAFCPSFHGKSGSDLLVHDGVFIAHSEKRAVRGAVDEKAILFVLVQIDGADAFSALRIFLVVDTVFALKTHMKRLLSLWDRMPDFSAL